MLFCCDDRPPRDFPFCKMDSHVLDTLGIGQEFAAIGGTSQWHWTLWVEVLYGLWLLICFQKCNIVLLNWNCWWEVGNCWFVGIGWFFLSLRGQLLIIIGESLIDESELPNFIRTWFPTPSPTMLQWMPAAKVWGGFNLGEDFRIIFWRFSCWRNHAKDGKGQCSVVEEHSLYW